MGIQGSLLLLLLFLFWHSAGLSLACVHFSQGIDIAFLVLVSSSGTVRSYGRFP